LNQRGTKSAEQPRSIAADACEQYHADLHRFLMRRLRSVQVAQDLAPFARRGHSYSSTNLSPQETGIEPTWDQIG